MLIAGAAVPLVTGLIGSYVSAVGKAGALARYGVVSMVVNIALTVPMVLLGSLGVVTATAIGQLVAACICCTMSAAPCGVTFPTLCATYHCCGGRPSAALTLWPRSRHPALPARGAAWAACGRRPGAGRAGLFGVLMLGPRRVLRIWRSRRSALRRSCAIGQRRRKSLSRR